MSDEEVPFTFSWVALRLLGSGLYSNPWSALSELVANGFDAGASTVWVDVDVRNKTEATIEIFDDGSGMDRGGIDTYVKVGHNKRVEEDPSDDLNRYMGRKGIGKLAALYLSDKFYLRTRHGTSDTAWVLDATQQVDPEAHPHLTAVAQVPGSENLHTWEALRSGTFLRLLNVDLSGNGEKAIEAFSARLANQFALTTIDDERAIMIRVRSDDKPKKFKPAEKVIAFSNYAFVEHTAASVLPPPSELVEKTPTLLIPAKLPDGIYRHKRELAVMPNRALDDKFDATAIEGLNLDEGTYKGVRFSLEGWIGIHVTIDSDAARRNDSRFARNRYYNPAQLRLYVHGKLASDRLLTQLGMTGTYLNYIEGEIRFEVLDDDRLDDIATSNRQDFDETDPRVDILRALVRPVVRRLMNRRQTLAKTISDAENTRQAEIDARGKQAFAAQLTKDFEHFDDITESTKNELHAVITNKLEGDARPKTRYSVFLSHSSSDKPFANFIYFLLRTQGATEDEIFYTSKPNDVSQYGDYAALSEVVKTSIADSNTLICYLTSRYFRGSEYCLFEGGAGWATRSIAQYLKLNIEYSEIPAFLTNGKVEFSLLDKSGTISLRPDVYNYVVGSIINPLLEHLNAGRGIVGSALLPLLDVPSYPTPLEMQRLGVDETSYFDPTVVEHWEAYVDISIKEYLTKYTAGQSSKV